MTNGKSFLIKGICSRSLQTEVREHDSNIWYVLYTRKFKVHMRDSPQ